MVSYNVDYNCCGQNTTQKQTCSQRNVHKISPSLNVKSWWGSELAEFPEVGEQVGLWVKNLTIQ